MLRNSTVPPSTSCPSRRADRDCHQWPVRAKLSHRSRARCRLGARSAARRGHQRSRAYAAIMDVYSGPTRRESPSAGTMPSRIARLLERRATAIIRSFGLRSSSGFAGIRPIETPRKSAIACRSAISHDSLARTAIRKHIPGVGYGRYVFSRAGAHSSRSRSHTASHGENNAARLNLLRSVANLGILRR